MSGLPPNHSFDRLRGWSLTALYTAMAILSLMLCYGVYIVRDQFMETQLSVWGSLTACLASALFNAAGAFRFFQQMSKGGNPPKLLLMPFLFMALAMALTGKLLTSIG